VHLLFGDGICIFYEAFIEITKNLHENRQTDVLLNTQFYNCIFGYLYTMVIWLYGYLYTIIVL
jgi:hypothetical protein